MDALCHSRAVCSSQGWNWTGAGQALNLHHQLNRINHLSISSQTGVQPCMWKQQPVPGD